MPLRRATLAVLLVSSLAASARAQGPAATGTGGGPASTATAPNTSTVGRTKPPGSAGEDRDGTRRTGRQEQDDRIQKGICIGCSPK